MIIHKDRLAGAIVGAEMQDLRRIVGPTPVQDSRLHPDMVPSRFKSVVDTNDHECGAVSSRYRLVQNGDLVAALDLASDKLGVELDAQSGHYSNGRSRYLFHLSDEYKVPGDPSEIKPEITIGNGYGGRGLILGDAGVYRFKCSNGMVIGVTIKEDTQKHVGNFDLMKFMENLISAVVARASAYKQVALITADMAFESQIDATLDEAGQAERERNRVLIETIMKDTGKRAQPKLAKAFRDNRYELGHTTWAILQAIAEVSTHHLQGWAASDWQRRQTNRVLETVGVAVHG